jgi:hypothetical protein
MDFRRQKRQNQHMTATELKNWRNTKDDDDDDDDDDDETATSSAIPPQNV